MEGTLADPPRDLSCAVCSSPECKQFHEAPYPDDYPFLPGGYARDAEHGPPEHENVGKRRRKLRCS